MYVHIPLSAFALDLARHSNDGEGNTPFIKENGCNKMTCTRSGCSNVQCYVCHLSCEYSHFDDRARGGAKGNCPLFDQSVEQRHENEVSAAEKQARQQVVDENPGVDAELLEVKISDKVVKDDIERRKKVVPLGLPQPPFPNGHAGEWARLFRPAVYMVHEKDG